MLKEIIIGAIGWQLITTVAFILSNEDEEISIFIGGGIPFWILYFSGKVIRKIRNWYRFKDVRSILTDGENFYYCKDDFADDIIEQNENLNFPTWTEEFGKQYPASLWAVQFQTKCSYISGKIGNFRYAPKEVWKNFSEITIDKQ